MQGRSVGRGRSVVGNWIRVDLAGRARDQFSIHEVVHVLAVLAVLPGEGLLDGSCGREVGDTAIPRAMESEQVIGDRKKNVDMVDIFGIKGHQQTDICLDHRWNWFCIISTVMCYGLTSFCAGTSSSPLHPFDCHGDFFLASSHRHHQLPPALPLPHLRQPLCSYVCLSFQPLLRHPRHLLHICVVTWASCAPTGLPLGCHSGCDDGAWTASPPSLAQGWLWHPIAHVSCGGGALLCGSACSLWTLPAPREAWPAPSLLRHHHFLPGHRVRVDAFVCGAHQPDGAGYSKGLNCLQ